MMENGFLGNGASLMLDFVVTALVLVVPVLVFSLFTVKIRKNYSLHKFLQITLAIVLLIAVLAFEIDMRLHGGWVAIVNKDATAPHLDAEQLSFVSKLLYLHLLFAVSTPFLWATTIFLALKRFPSPPMPGAHSKLHKRLGWISTIDLVLTSVTGLVFYYFAFIK